MANLPTTAHLIYKLLHSPAQWLVFLVILVPVELTVFTVMVSEWEYMRKPDQPLFTLKTKEHYINRLKSLEASETKWENHVLSYGLYKRMNL